MINDGVKIVSLTEQISLIAKETVEDFIIETIEPYCSEVAEIKISKEELKKVILKKYGIPKPKYCDRNICIKNECNGIGCDECEVTKSQEPCEDCISRQAYIERYRKWAYSEFGRKTDNEALAIRVAMSLPPVAPKPKTDVLDKIRAEIEQEYNRLSATRDETLELGECLGLKMSLKIIDKYTAESER